MCEQSYPVNMLLWQDTLKAKSLMFRQAPAVWGERWHSGKQWASKSAWAIGHSLKWYHEGILSICAEAQARLQGDAAALDSRALLSLRLPHSREGQTCRGHRDSGTVNSVCVSRSFCCSLLWSGGTVASLVWIACSRKSWASGSSIPSSLVTFAYL